MGAMREIVSEPRQYYCGMMKLSACRSVRTQRSSSDFFACSPILFSRLGLDGVRAVLHATTQRMAREFPWPVAGPGVYSLWPIQRDARPCGVAVSHFMTKHRRTALARNARDDAPGGCTRTFTIVRYIV